MFWVLCAVVGIDRYMNPDTGLIIAAVWVLALIVFVPLHELAHRIALRRQGATVVNTILWGLGGRTRGPGQFTRGQHIKIALAGPILSLVMAAIFYALKFIPLPETAPPLITDILDVLMNINVVIALLNFLPILPLDGGEILRALLGGQLPMIVLIFTLIFSILLAVFGVVSTRLMMPFLFIQLVWVNVGYLRNRVTQ